MLSLSSQRHKAAKQTNQSRFAVSKKKQQPEITMLTEYKSLVLRCTATPTCLEQSYCASAMENELPLMDELSAYASEYECNDSWHCQQISLGIWCLKKEEKKRQRSSLIGFMHLQNTAGETGVLLRMRVLDLISHP